MVREDTCHIKKKTKVEILQPVEMEVKMTDVYERRLHTRSTLNLSITRTREPISWEFLSKTFPFFGPQRLLL